MIMRLEPTAGDVAPRRADVRGPSDLSRAEERGSISLLMVGGVALAAVLCFGVARVGAAAMLAARADTAADAAALAGADALALGRSPAAATRAASAAASDNGARLLSCTCREGEAEVVVALGRAHGHARAVVDPSRLSGEPAPGP
jgi:secretion/DNA translocation related TadE-like protein